MRDKQNSNIIANIIGLLASIGGMVLTIIFLYFNPYDDGFNSGTVKIVYATLFAPAFLALTALLFKKLLGHLEFLRCLE